LKLPTVFKKDKTVNLHHLSPLILYWLLVYYYSYY